MNDQIERLDIATAIRVPEELHSQHFDPDIQVVARRVREGYDGPDSVFGDDTWDLLPGIGQESFYAANARLRFATLFAGPLWRITAKEFMMASLRYRIPGEGRYTPLKYTGALAELYDFRALVEFVIAAGAQRFSEVTSEILGAYVLMVANSQTGYSNKVGKLRVVKKLWHYRQYLSYDGLPAEPWPGKKFSALIGKGHSGENLTPRIPEEVMGPTLRWALRYVDDFADEIIEAMQSHRSRQDRAMRQRFEKERRGNKPWDHPLGSRTLLRKWIDQRRAEGRGIPRLAPGVVRTRVMKMPGYESDPTCLVNRQRVAQEAGLPHHMRFRGAPVLKAILREAIEELGWDQPGRTDRPSVFRLLGNEDGFIVNSEWRHLLVACYIVIAYLSGMRDSEVHSIRKGCLYTKPTRDGLRTRYMLRGKVYKGKDEEGEEVEWVVCEPIARAVRVLERMAEFTGGEANRFLLTRLTHVNRGKSAHFTSGMPKNLDRFRDHANELAALADDEEQYPTIPLYAGKPWHFQTRMLRRTMAWYIANRPFGIVAGAIQYKHIGITTFEGYAGTSKSGFRAEVAAEEVIKKAADLIDSFERARRGEVFAGGGGERLKAEMLRVGREIGDLAGKAVDEPRLRTILLHNFKTLVPGILNDCAFSAAQALCLASVPEEERAAPLVRLCDPVNCTNSSITQRHLPMYQLAYENADKALKTRGITHNQAKIIRERRSRYGRIRDELLKERA